MSDDPVERDQSIEAVTQRIMATSRRMEERIERLDARMESWGSQVEERLDVCIARLEAGSDVSLSTGSKSIDWLFYALIAVSAAIAVIMAKGFHWV